MTAKEFSNLTKKDFNNGIVQTDTFYALRDHEDKIKQLKSERLVENKKIIQIAKDLHSYIGVSINDKDWNEINMLWQRLETLEIDMKREKVQVKSR